MLDEIIEEKWLIAKASVGIWAANTVNDDDIEIYGDEKRTKILYTQRGLRQQLKKEYQKLIDEYKWNDLVYKSKFSFEPVIGKIYHLYYTNDGKIFLSLISPNEWKREHIGSFKYNHDNKWEKIED